MHLGRCWIFWVWAMVGWALLLSMVSYIGVLTGLPALVALVLVARRSPRWPEPFGLLTGFGGLCLTVAALNWREADGLDPAPWLAAGLVLALAGAAGYWLAARSSSR